MLKHVNCTCKHSIPFKVRGVPLKKWPSRHTAVLVKEYVLSSCTKGNPFIYIYMCVYSNPLEWGCKVFFNKQLHFKRPWHSVRTARHAFCKFPWKRCDNFYSCERRVALWQEWRINALALVVQKRRSMPRGTSSALETLLLVLVCTLCKGTAKLLRKKNNRFCVLRTSGRGTPALPRTRRSRCQVWTLEIISKAPELAQMPAKRILSVSSYSNLLTWLHGKKDAPGPGRPTGAPQDASKNIGRGTLANPGNIRKIRGTTGYLPLRQRYPNAPAVKISTFSEYLPLQTSGARYSGVPTRPRISPPFVNLGNHLE